MSGPEFTENDLWIVMWSLRDRYITMLEGQHRCSRLAASKSLAPEQKAHFAQNATGYTPRMAELAAVAAKLPDYLRRAFDQSIAEFEPQVGAA